MLTRVLAVLTGLTVVIAGLGVMVLAPTAAGSGDGSDAVLHPPRPTGELRLPLADGGTLRSADLRGRVTVIDVWAPWCAPCVTEIADLARLRRRYRHLGVEVVGVAMEAGGPAAVRRLMSERFPALDYPVAIGDDSFEAATAPLWALPTTYLVDVEGRIVHTWTGSVPDKVAQLGSLIERLLSAGTGAASTAPTAP